MIALLRMTSFHVRRFKDTPFFVQTLIVATFQVVALQALAVHASPSNASGTAWLRAGFVGMWSVTTVSAGILGFQRFQGTLVHMVRTPSAQWTTLVPIVGATSIFGLLALPLAGAGSLLLGPRPSVTSWPALLVAVAMFWLGCLVMSCAIGSIFILSRHATTYEAMVGIPVVLLSGVFGYPDAAHDVIASVAHALPLSWPVEVAFAAGTDPSSISWGSGIGWAAAVIVWAVAAGVLSRSATRRAIDDGSLELT